MTPVTQPTEPIFRADPYARSCEAQVSAAGAEGVRLDRTVFYPEGGGQPGDTGVLRADDGAEIVVQGTRKGEAADDILHLLAPDQPAPAPGSRVTAVLDWERRHRHMRMHTCLHLLSAVVDAPVTGGQLTAEKGRLDFDLDRKLEKAAVEEQLNALIARDLPVASRWISDEALAVQPELVRTMRVKPPTGHGRVRLIDVEGIDLQPCGGTHVARTGEIGPVIVRKIESKGRHNRRVTLAFGEAS